MNVAKNLMSLGVFLLMVVSCQTTDDPRRGGIFSYNPEAYERRIEERQATLEKLQNEKESEKIKTQEMEQAAERKRAELSTLNAQITELDKSIAKLNHVMEESQIETDEKKGKLQSINKRLMDINKKLEALDKTSTLELAKKEKEIKRLRQQVDALLEEAEALSEMSVD